MHEPRIAVVRALHGLGDMLCAVPALRALRAGYPRAEISLIGLPEVAWFVQRFPDYVDELVPFPGFPGIPETGYSPSALARLLCEAEAAPYDVAIQMHGAGTVSNAFTALLPAGCTAGLYREGQYCPAPETFFRYPETGSEIHRWLYLTDALDCPMHDDSMHFPIREEDRAAVAADARLAELEPRRYAVIHPGARDLLRRWPPACFAHVADGIAAKGYRIVLTGTRSERRAAETVAKLMAHDAVNAAGEIELGAAAVLLEGAALLVTNDTGISHLAAAVGTPSVIVFLASDVDRWAPLDTYRHRCVVAQGLRSRQLEPSRQLESRRLGRPLDASRLEGDRVHVSGRDVPEPDEVLEQADVLLHSEAAHA